MANDYGSGYRDGKRHAQLDEHLSLQRKQKEIDLLVEALMQEKKRVTRLREALQTFVEQWNACGPNSDFGRYFANVQKQAVAALEDDK